MNEALPGTSGLASPPQRKGCSRMELAVFSLSSEASKPRDEGLVSSPSLRSRSSVASADKEVPSEATRTRRQFPSKECCNEV